MRYFLSFMLFLTRLELQVARSTGRDPRNIAALRQDELMYEKALLKLELNA